MTTQWYVWWGMRKDIKTVARQCILCQTSKITRYTENKIEEYKATSRHLAQIHNHHQRQRCELYSVLWNALADSLGTKITHTTAYIPEANRITERLHRSLKASLATRCQGGSWRKELPWVLLGLRRMSHETFNASLAEIFYGQALALPADVFPNKSPTTTSETRKAKEKLLLAKTTYQADRKVFISVDLMNVKYAFIRVDAHKLPSPQHTLPTQNSSTMTEYSK
ncbi:uncharacterized protein [Macrobrachium rosenbergii]|uniref:uncharacterized protein n=1 Tax=Macrobrachium rosenbergii TaxID=79674 RepID=UPI0034D4AAAF